jgi:hypothetical protein
MVAGLEDRVLDLGLNILTVESAAIYITANEPTNYADATTGRSVTNRSASVPCSAHPMRPRTATVVV